MTYYVHRLNYSSYHNPDFRDQEISALCSIKSIEMTDDLDKADIIITNSNSDISQIKSKNIKLIIHPNSGYDNFSIEFVESFSGEIIIGNPIRAKAVAHYILSCLSEYYCSIPFSSSWINNRNFERDSLWDKNVLVFGRGHVGKIIEKSLSPLVANIEFNDPYENLKHEKELDQYDIIILAASLNSQNKHLINHDFLKRCKKNLLLINPARGKLIEEKAVVEFAKKNPKSFFFLDVFEKEPHPFFPDIPNIKTSSHIAGVFKNLDHEIIKFEEMILSKFISNNLPEELKLKNKIVSSILI